MANQQIWTERLTQIIKIRDMMKEAATINCQEIANAAHYFRKYASTQDARYLQWAIEEIRAANNLQAIKF